MFCMRNCAIPSNTAARDRCAATFCTFHRPANFLSNKSKTCLQMSANQCCAPTTVLKGMMMIIIMIMMTHPSRHYEIRLSLTQLCGIKPLQLPNSGQCAPHSGVSASLIGGKSTEAKTPKWSRHGAADRVAKAASDGTHDRTEPVCVTPRLIVDIVTIQLELSNCSRLLSASSWQRWNWARGASAWSPTTHACRAQIRSHSEINIGASDP